MHVKLSCPTVKAFYKDSLKRTEATFCSNKEKKPLFWPQESKWRFRKFKKLLNNIDSGSATEPHNFLVLHAFYYKNSFIRTKHTILAQN